MNEKIKRIMEDADIYDFVVEAMGIEEEMQKFAELIIHECADIADFCDQEKSIEAVSSVLKRHFGVEECVQK